MTCCPWISTLSVRFRFCRHCELTNCNLARLLLSPLKKRDKHSLPEPPAHPVNHYVCSLNDWQVVTDQCLDLDPAGYLRWTESDEAAVSRGCTQQTSVMYSLVQPAHQSTRWMKQSTAALQARDDEQAKQTDRQTDTRVLQCGCRITLFVSFFLSFFSPSIKEQVPWFKRPDVTVTGPLRWASGADIPVSRGERERENQLMPCNRRLFI